MIETLKPVYNYLLRPVARLLMRCRVHPNILTLSGVFLFIISGWLAASDNWFAALAWGLAGACMDGLDGLLAREANLQSRFGAILDSTCDRITEIAILGGLMVSFSNNSEAIGVYLCFAALSGSFMVSYVRARSEGAGIACSKGLLQRPERLIVLGTCMLFGHQVVIWGLAGITVLSFFTMGQRLVEAYRGSKKS